MTDTTATADDLARDLLPDCHRCGEDELGVIHRDLLLCYHCGWRLER